MIIEKKADSFEEDIFFWHDETERLKKKHMRRVIGSISLVALAVLSFATSVIFSAVTSYGSLPIKISMLVSFAFFVSAFVLAFKSGYREYREARNCYLFLGEIESLLTADVEKLSTRGGQINGFFRRMRDGDEDVIVKEDFRIPLTVSEIWKEEWEEETLVIKNNGLTLIRRWRK